MRVSVAVGSTKHVPSTVIRSSSGTFVQWLMHQAAQQPHHAQAALDRR